MKCLSNENLEPITLQVTEHYQPALLFDDGTVVISSMDPDNENSGSLADLSAKIEETETNLSFSISVQVDLRTGLATNLPTATPPSASQREQLRLAAWSARASRCDRELTRLRYAARRLICALAPRLRLPKLPQILTQTELSALRFACRLGLRYGGRQGRAANGRCCCCCPRGRHRCQPVPQHTQPQVCLGADPAGCLRLARRDAASLLRLLVPSWRSNHTNNSSKNSANLANIADAMLKAAGCSLGAGPRD